MMSAEQMRVELESFVNKGLKQGLKGWPVKGSSADTQTGAQTYYAMPTAAALFQGVTEGPFRSEKVWMRPAGIPLTIDFGLQKTLAGLNGQSLVDFSRKTRFHVTVGRIPPLQE